MKVNLISILLLFCILGCTSNNVENNTTASAPIAKSKNTKEELDTVSTTLSDKEKETVDQSIEAEAQFHRGGFDDKRYYELLIETHLCNPNYTDTTSDGSTPCSSRFFSFYSYNHKRKIDDAFLLQVRAGVNNYPYRRLLIFVREEGKLILMNGIVGYLVKRISRPNEIDDLIVAVFDDLGNDKFDRYDVLLRYRDGKYRFIEAVGDLHGEFDTPELKKKASKAIQKRINEKELIF